MKIATLNQTKLVKSFNCLYGDCFYIEFENGKSILLDSGTTQVGPYITEWLLEMGVTSIDYFILTHLHEDHSGGFASVAEKISISKVLSVEYGYDNSWSDQNLPAVWKKFGITPTPIRRGDDFSIGEVTVEILWPMKDAPEKDNLNNQSLVMKITEGNFSALFAADIPVEVEEKLVELDGERLKSTFLKVPHHGRDVTSAKHLIEHAQPVLAYVCHYSCLPEVGERFKSKQVPLYSPNDGTVTIETKENEVRVYSDNGCFSFQI